MGGFLIDQAEGLRRLLGKDFVRILTLTSAGEGVGKSTVALNLAAALAQSGKSVLIFDENGKDNLSSMLGLKPRADLLDVVKCRRPLDEAMLTGPEGISILQAGRGLEALPELDMLEQERLTGLFSHSADIVIIDTVAGSPSHLLSLSFSSQEIVVVLTPEAESIKEAYALIKMMGRDYAKRRFRVLVCKAKSEKEALVAFEGMAKVAKRYLSVSLDFMGCVFWDEDLIQACRLQGPVAEIFPDSDCAHRFRQMADFIECLPHPRKDEVNFSDFWQRLVLGNRLSIPNIRA